MPHPCGKVCYPNPATAWRVILRFTKPRDWLKHKEMDLPRRAYHCPRCQAWRLTHHPKPHAPRPLPGAGIAPRWRISA